MVYRPSDVAAPADVPVAPAPAGPTARRARRVRRWPHAMGGFVLGWLTGFLTLLVLSGLAVHLATLSSPATGDSDVRLQINIQYLNDVVQRRLASHPQVVVG